MRGTALSRYMEAMGSRPLQPDERSVTRTSRCGVMASALLALLLAALLTLAGCAASRGASLYRAGTRAISQGDTDRAIANLEEANALLPDRSEILNHLAIAYGSAGRTEEALALFERAAELDCRNAAAASNLAVAKQRVARHESIAPGSTGPVDPAVPAIGPSGDPDASDSGPDPD